MPQVTAISSPDQFHQVIATTGDDHVAIIDFWADWCGPCKMISPIFERMAEEEGSGKIKFYTVDVDKQTTIATEAGIQAMPTFVVYKNGSQVEIIKGANPPGLQALISKYSSC